MLIKLFSNEFCSRCHMISPKLKAYADANWLEYIEKNIKEATEEEIGDSTMLPIIWRWDEKIEFDEALVRLS